MIEAKGIAKTPAKIGTTTASQENQVFPILLVEDNLMAQQISKYLFDFLGLKIDIAANAKEAVTLFSPGKYEMILMDIGLPGMSGYELSKVLREIEKGSFFSVPIVGVSVHASEGSESKNQEFGLNEMLPKPLLLDQAKALLERYGIKSKGSSLDKGL